MLGSLATTALSGRWEVPEAIGLMVRLSLALFPFNVCFVLFCFVLFCFLSLLELGLLPHRKGDAEARGSMYI